MSDPSPFDVKNWPINIQIAWEPWATTDCVKILTFLISRKGKPAFSCRGLASILGSNKDSISRAINKLVENQYLVREGPVYYLNSSIEVDESRDNRIALETSVSKTRQKCIKTETESVSDQIHNNNKLIIINNTITDNSPHAPKILRRHKDPLINRGGKVWLTDKQAETLSDKMTNQHEYQYWIMRLNDWSEDNPKTFNQRRSHYDTILNLRRMEIGRGKKWCFVEDTQEWQYVFVGYKNLIKQGE